MEKVYLVLEKYTQDNFRAPEQSNTSIYAVCKTCDGAVNAAKKRHDEIIEEIIDGDENELSRISVDDFCEDGLRWDIVNDCCSEWELEVKENPLND